ncbi:type IV pilin N-terminal domain-containing protein [Methanococcoides sp. AM1]|uniref:type IV pilin N-terminal domain-containing protein n=1 Tax=Methanococcoides sp. AM1 TaxID=1201011 RepID=UPI0010826B90|nr:type IV pilin N-terminal domain-containing protein [Methanococcoides sp. AM1]
MVSEIIGEMLKLAIAVTLVSVLSIAVYGNMPDERVPYVEIEITNVTSSSADIRHVGGDPVHSIDMKILISNASGAYPEIKLNDRNSVWKMNWTSGEWENDSYMEYWKFGDTLHLSTNLTNITEISVVHPRAVLATAEVSPVW